MTNNVTQLVDHKEKRKLEVIVEDLKTVLYLTKLIKSGLSDYCIYVPVRDIFINITQNEKLLKKHVENVANKLELIDKK